MVMVESNIISCAIYCILILNNHYDHINYRYYLCHLEDLHTYQPLKSYLRIEIISTMCSVSSTYVRRREFLIWNFPYFHILWRVLFVRYSYIYDKIETYSTIDISFHLKLHYGTVLSFYKKLIKKNRESAMYGSELFSFFFESIYV